MEYAPVLNFLGTLPSCPSSLCVLPPFMSIDETEPVLLYLLGDCLSFVGAVHDASPSSPPSCPPSLCVLPSIVSSLPLCSPSTAYEMVYTTQKPGMTRGSNTPLHPWSAILVRGGTHIPLIALEDRTHNMYFKISVNYYCLKWYPTGSRGGTHIHLLEDDPIPHFNGAVLTIATVIKFDMTLAAEAELAALFITANEMVPHRQTLMDMG